MFDLGEEPIEVDPRLLDLRGNKKRAIDFPQIAMQRAKGVAQVYSIPLEKAIKLTVQNPAFIECMSDPHEALVKLLEIYGRGRKGEVINAITTQSSFVGYDHRRVLEEKSSLITFLEIEDDIRDVILRYPSLAGCSLNRDLAVIDVVKELKSNGYIIEDGYAVLDKNGNSSPYVRGYTRKGISQVREMGDKVTIMPKMYRNLAQSRRVRLSNDNDLAA